MLNMAGEMRYQAREALGRAEVFIAEGSEASARHACLELRLAIEYVVYQHLEAYLDEVPDQTMREWTPRDVIRQMLEVDPNADKTAQLSVGIEKEYGVPPAEMQELDEDRRFSLRWANTNHNALGNFLHAPTLRQISNGERPTAEKMLKKARAIAEVIRHTLSTSLINVNFGTFYTIPCGCGRTVKRRKGSFKKEEGIKCPTCKAVYDITDEADTSGAGSTTSTMRVAIYTCRSCGSERRIGQHQMKVGEVFSCDCGAGVEVCLALSELKHEAIDLAAAGSAAAG